MDANKSFPISLFPDAWVVLGPFARTDYGADPLRAFGGLTAVINRAPEELWKALRDRNNASQEVKLKFSVNKTVLRKKVNEKMQASGGEQLRPELRKSLESFPTEYGPQGRTLWAMAYSISSSLSFSWKDVLKSRDADGGVDGKAMSTSRASKGSSCTASRAQCPSLAKNNRARNQ